jgi:hypothetical protein
MQQLRNLKDLSGFGLQARDGEIGKVDDFIIGDPDWSIGYVAITLSVRRR